MVEDFACFKVVQDLFGKGEVFLENFKVACVVWVWHGVIPSPSRINMGIGQDGRDAVIVWMFAHHLVKLGNPLGCGFWFTKAQRNLKRANNVVTCTQCQNLSDG